MCIRDRVDTSRAMGMVLSGRRTSSRPPGSVSLAISVWEKAAPGWVNKSRCV